MLTHERLLSLLSYEKHTGIFRWRVARSNVAAGSVAGAISKISGYREIRLDRRLYGAARLAWFYVTGDWPKVTVDHCDTDRTNDAWENLREASYTEQAQNRPNRSDNKSGFKGVSRHSHNARWIANICIEKRQTYLGSFDDPAVAYAAYLMAAQKHFGKFANGG
jgi:hypothetical protein